MTDELKDARDVAVLALKDRSGNVTAHLDRLVRGSSLAPADKRLARELALGAVRRRGTLDAVLRAFLAQPEKRLPSPLTEILHVALHQMLFLERVPDFAAVDQAVRQTVRLHHKRQRGLINGVLRTIARSISEPTEGPPPARADAVFVSPRSYRLLGREVFPNPAGDPAAYLAQALSLPEALARRWVERLGGLERAMAVAAHANARAPMILRVNSLKGGVAGAVEALAAEGVAARPHANGVSVVLEKPVNPTRLKVFEAGLLQVQDATATDVCIRAEPAPGMRVLDFCAAPGTKTTHLAELMDNSGSITALDVSDKKLRRIEDNCRRMGIDIVSTMLSERAGSLEPASFDLALVDVPCSNTGVLARRAEARWRFDEASLAKLAGDQRRLVQLAAEFVRPGGRLVYSTCSIEPEENEHMMRSAAGRGGRLELLSEHPTLPSGADEPTQWRDGGYTAICRRR